MIGNLNNLLRYVSFLIVVFIQQSCLGQKSNELKDFEIEPMKFEAENVVSDTSQLIKRVDPNQVQITFFEEFEDSVILYLNSSKKGEWLINKKDNPFTSTGYSGKDLNLILYGTKNMILIKLKNQKKYIQFRISREYPWYVIQRYNGTWYVRAQKSHLNLK